MVNNKIIKKTLCIPKRIEFQITYLHKILAFGKAYTGIWHETLNSKPV